MAQRNLGPQPNFHNLVQGVNAVVNEATLIPNIPLVGQADHVIQLLQQIEARPVTIDGRLVTIEAKLFDCLNLTNL